MLERRLTHAVTDLEGNLLLDAGTRLTSQCMHDFLKDRPNVFPTCPLLNYRQVRTDLVAFFEQPPYDVIFSSADRQQVLLDIAGEVIMPEAVMESLYRFRDLDFYTYRHILLVFALAMAALIAFTHRSNIARMRRGEESRFSRSWLARR
jgi:hypothetical protein